MEEFRIIGPPGTGKTTWIAKHVEAAVQAAGRTSVLVTSLTKAAAREIGSRGLPVDREQVSTLHAHAWRALGRPPVAAGKALKPWNDTYPRYALSAVGGDRAYDDGADTASRLEAGEEIMLRYSALRSRRVPQELWPQTVKTFAVLWEAWKRESGLIDFTDMIELAERDTEHAPGHPAYIFCDEAQDMDRLQLALVRKWAQHAVRLLVVGDPYQNLYEWRGTDARSFFDPPVDQEHLRVLRDSWRVPEAVHATAMRWVSLHPDYELFDYRARNAPGRVEALWAPYKHPRPILSDMVRHLEEGKRVMILAACGYLLAPVVQALRSEGVPFHNPYRVRRGDWNPLRKRDRVLSYLATDGGRLWTWKELWRWVEVVSADGLVRHGMKAAIEASARKERSDDPVREDELLDLFEPDACEVGDLEWFRSRLLATAPRTIRYLVDVALRRGKAKLSEEPRVIVGTIHSVKGGESDVVYLFPNLSRLAMQSWLRKGSPGYGAIVRQFYVGMTRARETLVLCMPSDPACVRIAT